MPHWKHSWPSGAFIDLSDDKDLLGWVTAESDWHGMTMIVCYGKRAALVPWTTSECQDALEDFVL